MARIKRADLKEDLRSLYRKALDPLRFTYPERSIVHPVRWYLECDQMRRRPTYGIYAMAQFSEYLLYRVRGARRRRGSATGNSLQIATGFFAETRRALQNVLSTYSVGKRRNAKEAESLRRVFDRLYTSAKETYRLLRRETDAVVDVRMRLSVSDAELLESILVALSGQGVIPKGSKLFREQPLTPNTVI